MRSIFLFSVLLLCASSSQAQFVALQQDRSVSGHADMSRLDYPLPAQDYHVVDTHIREAPDFGPFDASVTARLEEGSWHATQTAWQQSSLSSTELTAK